MKHRIVKKTKKKIQKIRQWMDETRDLKKSRYLDVNQVQTVCLMLGPYRNLTTLTASTLFLHENCQVLNHAGARIFGNRKVDFLMENNQDKLHRFIQLAIWISAKGSRGDRGGSITYSHAFDEKYKISELYQQNHTPQIKKKINCLLWKESQRTANIIRERNIDIGKLLKDAPQLRFLLPIRHPLDCAVSNLNREHVNLLKGCTRNSSVQEVSERILDEIFWFSDLRQQFPDRFFYFFAHGISRNTLIELCSFLKLTPDEEWLSNALSAMTLQPGYDHDSQTVQLYRDYVEARASENPDLTKGLLQFVD